MLCNTKLNQEYVRYSPWELDLKFPGISSQEKFQTMIMQFFFGGGGGERCIMGFEKIMNNNNYEPVK